MSNRAVSVGGLSEAVKKILDEYGEDAKYALEDATKSTARKVAKELRQTSPGSGRYRKSWATKSETSRFSTTSTVYSKIPGLPHLLEFPHMLRNGRASKPQKHIQPVYDKADETFEQELRKKLEKL